MFDIIFFVLYLIALFSFPFATLSIMIGLGLIIWYLFKERSNKKSDVKSKIPSVILSIAILIMVGGIGLQASAGNDVAIEGDISVEREIDNTLIEEDPDTDDTKGEKEEDLKSESVDEEEKQSVSKEIEQDEIEKLKVTEKDQQRETETKENLGKSEEKDTKTKTESLAISEKTIVTRIVDGDTIEINYEGKTESVRLLLVDTPETKHPNLPVQPFGPEASEFAEKTLAGKTVQVEFDGPKRDKYDRLLAYLWIDGKNFNKMLLENGLARYAYVYDPPYKYQETMKQRKAEQKIDVSEFGV